MPRICNSKFFNDSSDSELYKFAYDDRREVITILKNIRTHRATTNASILVGFSTSACLMLLPFWLIDIFSFEGILIFCALLYFLSMAFKPIHRLLTDVIDLFAAVIGIFYVDPNESRQKEYKEMNRLNTILGKYGYMVVDDEVIKVTNSS